MRRVRTRKGAGAILLFGIVLTTLYVSQVGVLNINRYRIPSALEYSALSVQSEKFSADNAAADDAGGVRTTSSPSFTLSRLPSSDNEAPPYTRTCKPIRNIAFIKTHKAGSTTVANILQRFGRTYDLNFAVPRKVAKSIGFNYIVRPGEVFTAQKLIPLSPNSTYNVLWCHSIYNKTAFHSIMPPDTAYISIIREPFQQFISAFAYYSVVKVVARAIPSIMNDTNPISTFLAHSDYQRKSRLGYHFGYIRNKQAQDFGFTDKEFYSSDKRATYIKELEKDFTFIMIMEHFDESLLLLKHKLCWDMKDILYIPKNINSNKPKHSFSPEDRQRHKAYSKVDYSLYSHFSNIYNDTIEKQSSDFFQELAHFKDLLVQVRRNCLQKRSFTVLGTRWHARFHISDDDCTQMTISELQGLLNIVNGMEKKI